MGQVPSARWARNWSDLRDRQTGGLRANVRDAFLRVAGRAKPLSSEPALRCFYCHYVYDDQVREFRDLLRRLRDVGTFVTTEEVLQIANGTLPLRGRSFHLSIDDGFDNVYRNAFPVLQELGIPAALFVPSGFIGASDQALLDGWWLTDHDLRPTRTLDWARLREMHDHGCDVGSHTRSHARLSEVSGDAARLADEVAGSKREIEDRIGAPCRFFSWPYGTMGDVDEVALAAVENAGYELSFSAVRGRVVPRETRLFAVPRHHFEPEWPWAHVRYFAAGGREQ